MRKEYEALIERIEAETTWYADYCTEHDDAGADLALMIPDDLAMNNGAERLERFCESHDLDLDGVDLDRVLSDLIDVAEIWSHAGIFAPSSTAYTGNEESLINGRWEARRLFQLSSWIWGETEAQIDLGNNPFELARAALIARDSRDVCVTYRPGDRHLYSHEHRDGAWIASVSIADVIEAIDAQLEERGVA